MQNPVLAPRMEYPWEKGKTIRKIPLQLSGIQKKLNQMVPFMVLLIVLLGALTGNIYQIQKINRMNDNDIKYLYIKTANGITHEDLYKHENIFNYNRDKKLIKEIRKEVEDYEKKIRERAGKIERDRLTQLAVNPNGVIVYQ